MTVTLQPSNIFRFDCELCDRSYEDMIEYLKHIIESLTSSEKFHETQDLVDCPFCAFELTHPESRILLNALEFHLADLHNVKLQFIKYLDHLFLNPDGKYGDWLEGVDDTNRIAYVHLQHGTSDEILFVLKKEDGSRTSNFAKYIIEG